MNFLNRFAGIIALIALVIGGLGVFTPVAQDINAALGAFDIPTRFPNGHLDTNGGYYVDGVAIIDGSGALSATTGAFSGAVTTGKFTQGGSTLATSTVTSATVLNAATLGYSEIEVTVNLADLTYTFPASSTLSAIVPNAGDRRDIVWYNATSTAGIDVIFAAGTGSEIKSTAGSGALTIDEASFGIMTLVRKQNSDILILLTIPDAD